MTKKIYLKQLLVYSALLSLFACIPQNISETENIQAPVIRVLLAQNKAADKVSFNGVYYLDTEEARYEFGSSNSQVVIEPIETGFKVHNNNRMFLFRHKDAIEFIPENSSSLFEMKGNAYSGSIKISMADSSSLYLINNTNLENYLKGVVPAEIYTKSTTYIEAVKAQAICARTYALKKMQRKKSTFDVYDDTRDQVYKGDAVRTKNGDKAVDATVGSVLMYNQKLAETYFHSTCGGILENAAQVWSDTIPYLVVQQDVIGKQFADINSPYFRWTETRSLAQLDSIYRKNYNVSYMGKVVNDTMDIPFNFSVDERTASGRVKKMTVQYGEHRNELETYEIRRFLGWPIGKLLPSTLFKLAESDSGLVIKGAGNGHGVGMCQHGAIFKAEQGLKYYHILQSYYTGTILSKAY